ncbi:hypothetical protein Pan97_31660 [Bremerella volcania]|uniref:Uncharacterized protein n=1 Tax=Bremerella volcania TaxID=2527984 RepID=A0A518CA65_9BACT|nr:hypothetical protein Pan97_31660 [Bremerella volcania]
MICPFLNRPRRLECIIMLPGDSCMSKHESTDRNAGLITDIDYAVFYRE